MENEKLELVQRMKKNFDIHNMEDYQKLFYILYNEFASGGETLIKYKLFSLLEDIIERIEKDRKRNVDNFTVEELYNSLISFRMLNNEVFW